MPQKATRPAPTLPVADRLHSAAIHLLRRVRKRDVEMGIGPAQASALSVLVFGGPRSLGELAAAEGVRAPTMSRIIAGLRRAGLVRRRQNTNDLRGVTIQASARGRRLLWVARRRRVADLAERLAGLEEASLNTLSQAAAILEGLARRN